MVASSPNFDVQPLDAKSAQVSKLIVVQMTLEKYIDISFNLFTDSQYVNKILAPLETAAYIAFVLESRCNYWLFKLCFGPNLFSFM